MRSKFTTHSLFALKPGYRFYSQNLSSYGELKKQAILEIASNLTKNGKVRSAEDIYKEVIKLYPHDSEAYSALWASWLRNRKLNVSKLEMEDFLKSYSENIDGTHPFSSKHT